MVLGLGVTQDPDPIYSFFLAKCLLIGPNFNTKTKLYMATAPGQQSVCNSDTDETNAPSQADMV